MSNGNGELVKFGVTVDRPREQVYNYWREWENLPHFARHLVQVKDIGGGLTEWTAEGPTGEVTWQAETIDDKPGRQIGWRTVKDSDIQHHGVVMFDDAPGDRGTEVRVYLSYKAPVGWLGKMAAKVTGNEPSQAVEEMMRRFKALLECGSLPVVEGQPSNLMRNDSKPGEESQKVGFR